MADEWTQVAPGRWAIGANVVHRLHEFKTKLYGGAGNAYLLEWNSVDAWIAKAKSLHHEIYSVITFNNKLYCGDDSGTVLIWNEDGVLTEEQDLGTDAIKDFLVFEGQLYCIVDGGAPGGCLYRRSAGGVWSVVAPRYEFYSRNGFALTTYTYVNPITELEETRIFGSVGGLIGTHYLLRWNGVDAWEAVASTSTLPGAARDLIVLEVDRGSGPEDILMGCTSTGELLEWNKSDAWIERAPKFLGRNTIYGMAIIPATGTETNVLIAVTSEGDLFRWNGVDAWVQLVSPFRDAGAHSVIMYNDKVYAGCNGTPTGGNLLSWTPPPITPVGVPYNLHCEQKTNPTDVTDPNPEFSAIYP